MRVMPSITRFRKQMSSQPSRLMRILFGMLVLLILYPLASCSSLDSTVTASGSMVSRTPGGFAPGIERRTPPSTPTKGGSPTATPTSLPPQWKLLWSDEFNGPQGASPDTSKWWQETGGDGWAHKQLDYDTSSGNAYTDGQGNIVLEARKENPDNYQCWYGSCQYTSVRLTTEDLFSFTYGLVEARIKLPAGQGLWPAFWMVGTNHANVPWPAPGEIDIMENVGKQPSVVNGTAHGLGIFQDPGQGSTYALPSGTFADGYHVFAVQWDAGHLYYMVDGNIYFTITKADLNNQSDWVFDHPFFLILNNAVGGEWPGSPDDSTVFPAKMIVDYVRVYTNTAK